MCDRAVQLAGSKGLMFRRSNENNGNTRMRSKDALRLHNSRRIHRTLHSSASRGTGSRRLGPQAPRWRRSSQFQLFSPVCGRAEDWRWTRAGFERNLVPFPCRLNLNSDHRPVKAYVTLMTVTVISFGTRESVNRFIYRLHVDVFGSPRTWCFFTMTCDHGLPRFRFFF